MKNIYVITAFTLWLILLIGVVSSVVTPGLDPLLLTATAPPDFCGPEGCPPCTLGNFDPSCFLTLTPQHTALVTATPQPNLIPAGAFGGFRQQTTGNTLYTSLEYQIVKDDSRVIIRMADGSSVDIPVLLLAEAENTPASSEPLFEDGQVALYRLTTGEFQINIGPDESGEVRVIIFDGLDAEYVYGYTFNVRDILNP